MRCGDAARASLAPPGHGGRRSPRSWCFCCSCGAAAPSAAATAAAGDPQAMKIEMKLIDSAQQPRLIYPPSDAEDPIAIRMRELCPLSARMWTKDPVGNNEALLGRNPLGGFISEKPSLKRSKNARVSWWWVACLASESPGSAGLWGGSQHQLAHLAS